MLNQIGKPHLPMWRLAKKVSVQPFRLPRNAGVIESPGVDLRKRMGSFFDLNDRLVLAGICSCRPAVTRYTTHS
jgi:hypothetical protein